MRRQEWAVAAATFEAVVALAHAPPRLRERCGALGSQCCRRAAATATNMPEEGDMSAAAAAITAIFADDAGETEAVAATEAASQKWAASCSVRPLLCAALLVPWSRVC